MSYKRSLITRRINLSKIPLDFFIPSLQYCFNFIKISKSGARTLREETSASPGYHNGFGRREKPLD